MKKVKNMNDTNTAAISHEPRLCDVKIIYSNGYGKNGKLFAFVRPANTKVFQNSRRVGAFSSDELKSVIDRTIKKWYTPMLYFQIDGVIVGSNSDQNALTEYWRVCDKSKIGKPFPVVKINVT